MAHATTTRDRSAHSSSPAAAPSTPDLRRIIGEELPGIIAIRHDLHAHPEMAYHEHRTAKVVCDELTRLGIRFVKGLAGGTGVLGFIPATHDVGTDDHGASRESIALRADMDALPIEENTGAPYTSTVKGCMHACGHDGHTANLLGVARVLMRLAHRPNPVHLVFQPAEEGGGGGDRMCKEGCLNGSLIGPRVKRIYGLHGWPQYELGVVGSRPGPLLASTDNFEIRVVGEQAHAAYPQLARDPIVCAAAIITALQTIASRSVAPLDSVVVSTTTINGGTATNIIPRSITFGGTVRTLRPETRTLARERLHQIASGVAAAHGCEAQIEYDPGYPVTFNDLATTERFMRVATDALGEARVRTVEHPTMGGEDFSYYGHHVPACFYILGVRAPGAATWPSLHQPEYDFNDDALPTGIETMARLVLDAD